LRYQCRSNETVFYGDRRATGEDVVSVGNRAGFALLTNTGV